MPQAPSGRVAIGGGAQGDGAGAHIVRLAIAAMGTRFELAIVAADEEHACATGELALDEIRLAHDRLSAFAPASLVSAINRTAGATAVTVDPATFALLQLAAEVHQASGGAFDITLGPLMRAWGFRGEAGPPEEVAQARRICGMELLRLDGATRRVSLAAAGAQLDLGAIAKGHALDLAGAVLREHGIECALLHAGTSTTLALGAPPGQPGWRIALADRGERLEGGPVVTLRDQALSVSSPSGREIDVAGEVRAHVLDPRTGAPARAARYAAAVIPAGCAAGSSGGDAGARADAWSTALLVGADRPRGAPVELNSLILPAGAGGWQAAGPAASTLELNGEFHPGNPIAGARRPQSGLDTRSTRERLV